MHPIAPPPGRTYSTFEELTADYESGALHPADLKPALAKHLNAILQPVGAGPARRRCHAVLCCVLRLGGRRAVAGQLAALLLHRTAIVMLAFVCDYPCPHLARFRCLHPQPPRCATTLRTMRRPRRC